MAIVPVLASVGATMPIAPVHSAPPQLSTEAPRPDGPSARDEAPPPATPPGNTTADAQLGDDEVALVNGGFLRGTVIEAIPNERVVLVDGNGVRREIPWEQVAEVQRGKYAASRSREPAPAAPPATPAPPEDGLGRPRIRISLLRDASVNLYEVSDELVASGYGGSIYGMNYRSVCAAPCARVVDGTRGQDFFLARSNTGVWTASRRFTLADRRGDVTIEVKPGNKAMRIAGAVLTGFGLGFAIGGGILAIPRTTRTPGLIMLVAGVPLFFAGIPMMILGRTRYRFLGADG